MNDDMRSALTVTADASQVVTENRRAVESQRELQRATEETSRAMIRAGDEQAKASARQSAQSRAPASVTPFPSQQDYHITAFREYQREAENAAKAYRALEDSLQPIVRVERELASAQEVVNRALAAGRVTAEQAAKTLAELERRFEGVLDAQRMGPGATEFKRALEADERAVRQLMATLDPASRAAREFEQSQQLITRSLRQGIITSDEATRAMARLEAAQATAGRTGVTMGHQVQNASFQVTDAIVQIQGGVAPSVAIAQQLPQLLGGFGALGAVLGLVVAVGAPLAAMWMRDADAAGSLDDRLQALETSLGSVRDHMKILQDTKLDDTFGSLSGSARSLTEELLKLDRAAELKNFEKALDETLKKDVDPGFWQRLMASYISGQDASGAFDRDKILGAYSQENYTTLTGGRGPSYDEFQSSRAEITALAKAGEVEKVVNRVDALLASFAEGGPITELNADLVDMLSTMGDWARRTAEVEALYNGSAEAARKLREEEEKAAEGRKDGAERIRIAEQELALRATITRYGEDSRQAEVERDRIARENYDLELQRANVLGDQRTKLMEIWDQNNAVTDATAAWAERMSGVRSEVDGILSALGSMAGGLVDRAAKQAELQALQAGATVSDAAAAGRTKRREIQKTARAGSLGGGWLGNFVASAESAWDASGDAIDQQIEAARAAARERDRKSKGGSASRGLGAISGVKEELARLRPSYDADIDAADAWREKALASLDKTKAGYEQFARDVKIIYDEKVADAYEADLKRRDDWAAGSERAQLKLGEDMMTWADLSEGIFTKFAEAGEDAFASLAVSGKVSMADMVDFVVEQFARLAYQQAIQPGFSQLLNSASNVVGAWFGATPTTTPAAGATTVKTQHTGSPGVQRSYALNGYGDTPRREEHLTMVRDGEQIMTSRALENAGALISAMSSVISKSNQAINVDSRPIINPVNKTGRNLDFEVEETTDSSGRRRFDLVASELVTTGISAKGGKARKQLARMGVRDPGVRRP